MNFDALPFIHSNSRFVAAVGTMLTLAIGFVTNFWSKRYLGSCGR